MSNTNFSLLKITTTGESMRGVFALRLKEYDRTITRGEQIIATSKVELAEVEREADVSIQRVRQRSGYVPPGMSGMGGIGMSQDPAQFKRVVDQLENQIAKLKHNRALAQWLHDQFVPSNQYEIGSYDLIAIGLNHPENTLQDFENTVNFLGC